MLTKDRLLEKINDIIHAYIKNECKTWNIGTSFTNTWIKFAKDLKKITYEELEKAECIDIVFVKEVEGTKKSKKPEARYKVQILNNDINCWRDKEPKSLAAIRQMLQVGDAFGFVSYNGCIKSDSAFPLLKNISELFIDNFENNLHNLLYKVMCKAFTSKNKWVKNLGFTIFLTFLYSNNIWDIDKNCQIAKWVAKRTPSKGTEENLKYIMFGSEQYKKHIEETYKDTYKNSCKILKNNFNFEYLINKLWKNCKENNNEALELLLSKEESEFVEQENIFSNISIKIKNERSKLRENIIKNRWKDDPNNDLDIEKKWKIINCDAAHIFDVYKIQSEAKRCIYKEHKKLAELDYLVGYASNINNGLILKKDVHSLLDNDVLRITHYGEIIFDKEHKEEVEEAFGCEIKDKIFIKKSILDNGMIDFIKKR